MKEFLDAILKYCYSPQVMQKFATRFPYFFFYFSNSLTPRAQEFAFAWK